MRNWSPDRVRTKSQKKIIVIPCSGIGKALGSVSREATYELVENLRRGVTETTCLALLISGDKDALELVRNNKCITIDGCPLQCAEKNLNYADGDLAASFRVIDVLAQNRNLKPRKVTFLDHDGLQLARMVAEEVTTKVDDQLKE
jgi:uncharacterized metal-binding protein